MRDARGKAHKRVQGPRQKAALSIPEAIDPVDQLLQTNPRLIRLNSITRKLQHELRDLCSKEAWAVYLRIEELVNERTFTLVDLLLGKRP